MMTFKLCRRPLVDDSSLPAEMPARLRQIYASRGIRHKDELERSAGNLLAPQGLKGLPQALDLLTEALQQQRRIIIVGDFDCDGGIGGIMTHSPPSREGSQVQPVNNRIVQT